VPKAPAQKEFLPGQQGKRLNMLGCPATAMTLFEDAPARPQGQEPKPPFWATLR